MRMKVQDQNNKQLDVVGNMKLRLDANKVNHLLYAVKYFRKKDCVD